MAAARDRIPGSGDGVGRPWRGDRSGGCDLSPSSEDFHVVTPDGQPVRHALNLLYSAGLRDRVYGPELTVRLCKRAAECAVPVYLYGSTLQTVSKLRDRLIERFPALKIIGAEPSVFRPLSAHEDHLLIERINGSDAGIVFIGLGCPRQGCSPTNTIQHYDLVQVCVGAAFDFIAGTKRIAPWMQDHALEWLYRFEPGAAPSVWRYTRINAKFLAKLLVQLSQSAWAGGAVTLTSNKLEGSP